MSDSINQLLAIMFQSGKQTAYALARYCSCFCFVLLQFSISTVAQENRRALVDRGKKATAFLRLGRDGDTATAFCISAASGLFITNAHAVESLKDGDRLDLILNSGQADQRKLVARVIRRDEEADLAVLSAPNAKQLTELKLATTDSLQETDSVYAFGYPFGKALAVDSENPNVSVSIGRVTSLRRKKGKLDTIQLDATLNPGNSGGPVLNDDGDVVGIVHSGLLLTGVNFAIPASKCVSLLKTPVLSVVKPNATPSPWDRPIEFIVKADTLMTNPADLQLEVKAEVDGKLYATQPMQRVGDEFRTTLAPPISKEAGEELTVTLTFEHGSITAQSVNANLPVGPNETAKFSELRTVEFAKSGSATIRLLSGKVARIKLPTSGSMTLRLGDKPLLVPLAGVKKLAVTQPERKSTSVKFSIAVRLKNSVVQTIQIDQGGIRSSSKAMPGNNAANIRPPVHIGASRAARFVPPALKGDDSKLTLPGQLSNIVLGGGGRYLILHLEKERKLALFDASQGKIDGYISLNAGRVVYTAGMSDLIIAYPDTRVIQRWDLESRQRRLSRSLPFNGVIKTLAMGAGSQGPLLILHSRNTDRASRLNYEFFDPTNFSKLPIEFDKIYPRQASQSDIVHIRPSMDGTVFGCRATSHSPTGIEAIILTGNKAKSYYAHDSTVYAVPGHDGSVMYSSIGRFNSTALEVIEARPIGTDLSMLPSTSPEYDISFAMPTQSTSNDVVAEAVSIHVAGEEEALVTVPQIPMSNIFRRDQNEMTFDRRIWFIPQGEMIVAAEYGSKSLFIRKVNIEELLKEADVDFLYVESQPPLTAKVGQRLEYQIRVKSRQGGVKYSLESGPTGMELNDSGLLTWTVPRNRQGNSESVIILVSDRSGMQKYHKFDLKIL